MLNEIIVDVFAGGGGASSSIACAVGRSVDVAIDHDPAAIVMHRANHPHTKHLLQPIGGYTMNLEGKIVFISGAITGVDGYRKFFPLQNNGYSNRGYCAQSCSVAAERYGVGGVPSHYKSDGMRSGCCLCPPKLGTQQRCSGGAGSRRESW